MPDRSRLPHWTTAVNALAVLVVGAAVLWTALALTGPDYRGGTVRACQAGAAPANATVVPAANATVREAHPVLRAVANATSDGDSPVVVFSPAEQASVEAFADRVPAGPAPPDGSDCSGGSDTRYVRSGGDPVAVTVAFNT